MGKTMGNKAGAAEGAKVGEKAAKGVIQKVKESGRTKSFEKKSEKLVKAAASKQGGEVPCYCAL